MSRTLRRGLVGRGCRKIKMALIKTGSLLFKSLQPTAVNPLFVIPSTVNIQVRNAKRKGYREKMRRLASLKKAEKKPEERKTFRHLKAAIYEKTVEPEKPDLPNDDIIIMEDFKYMKFSISEAVKLHREFHHPTVFNNPEAYVHVDIELDMTGKKLTQVMKTFSGVAPMPHHFVYKFRKEVMVFCTDEFKEEALSAGAAVVGGEDLIKKIQGGIVKESLYEYIICHIDFYQELTPIRGLLKTKLPRAKAGTLTANLKSSIEKFLYGVEYACVKPVASSNFGFVRAPIGTVNMELEHLEENFKSLLAEVVKHRKSNERDFVTWVWCRCPPSDEKFSIDLSRYVESTEDEHADEDSDDDEDNTVAERKERLKIRKLREAEEAEQASAAKV